MPLLRHFRPLLERLLEVSVKSEATARERALEREIKQLKKTLGEQESDARAACDQLGVVIQDHKATIDNLNVIAATREDRIDSLEHEIEILKQDLRGMASVCERSLKWIQCIRTAEEQNTSSNDLAQQVAAAVQDLNPWETT